MPQWNEPMRGQGVARSVRRMKHGPAAWRASSSRRFVAGVCALCVCLAGCAPLPPRRQALPQRDLAAAQLPASIHLAREGWPDAAWWKAYGDPQLDALMARALQSAPTLQAAAARIGEARSILRQQHAARGLDVGLNGNVNRQRYSSNGLFPPPIGGSIYSETTLEAQADYDFDWWGRHRAQIAAALGEVNARRADYAEAERGLTAAVAQHYVDMQADWAQLDNLREVIAARQALLQDSRRRVAHGLASTDLEQDAEQALADSSKQAAAAQARADSEREALRALLGDDARALADLRPQALPKVAPHLPATLGIELLARRPDLQAARWRVEAALSRVEAARAAFYPDVNLKAWFGLDSLSLRDLLQAGSRTFYLGPTVSLPLFDSGRLEAGLGAANAQRDSMIADYNQAVVNAVRDVAQDGVMVQGLERQAAQQARMTQAAQALLDSAQRRFRQGLIDRADVLDAKLALLRQQQLGLQLHGNELQAEIALTQALGGGFRQAPAGTATAAAPVDATRRAIP